MIKTIVKFILKVPFLEKILDSAVNEYLKFKSISRIEEERAKKIMLLRCQQNLALVMKYEKEGPASGLPAPKVYKMKK